ncbi:MAG: hypothetical protein PUE18_05895 [Firmicutes bacterium]|nr:hypothetical protein [Bacillota bacterium]
MKLARNLDGSYSFSDSYIEDVKQIEGMNVFSDEEIYEILNDTGSYLICRSGDSAKKFIKGTMKFYEPGGLNADNSKPVERATATPTTPAEPATPMEPMTW